MHDTPHQTKLSHRQVPANCADEMAEHGRRENTFSTTKGPTDKSTDAFAGITIQFLVSQALAVCISSALLLLVVCIGLLTRLVTYVPRSFSRPPRPCPSWDDPKRWKHEALVKSPQYLSLIHI